MAACRRGVEVACYRGVVVACRRGVVEAACGPVVAPVAVAGVLVPAGSARGAGKRGAGNWDRDGSPAVAPVGAVFRRDPGVAPAPETAADYRSQQECTCSLDQRNQPSWPANSEYPTKATALINVCAMINGHSLPVRCHA